MKYIYPDKILTIFERAQAAAQRLKHTAIAPEHLIMGIVADTMNRARTCFLHYGVNVDILDMRTVFLLNNRYATQQQPEGDDVVTVTLASKEDETTEFTYCITKDTERLLRLAELEARMLQDETLAPEHLCLAMLKDAKSTLSQIMTMYRVTYNKFREFISLPPNLTPHSPHGPKSDTSSSIGDQSEEDRPDHIDPVAPDDEEKTQYNAYDDNEEDDDGSEEDEENEDGIYMNQPSADNYDGPKLAPTQTSSRTPVLDKYGTDISAAAEQGLLDPVVGRNIEVELVIQALLRRRKNNPVLIGEPGVGKTAVVEGLAMRIARHDVCLALQNKRIVSIDMARLVAGTTLRGQFEKRMTAIIEELRDNKNIIAFIDEIHLLVGAGAASGSLDAANVLKPALSRGEFQCIGATTLDEYRKSIEKDGALERRFQKVMIEPTSAADTLLILQNLKERYEEFHHVRYTDEALQACVRLTEQYITNRNFPDKAIDAMDEAGARAHVKVEHRPEELQVAEDQLKEAIALKEKAIKAEDFEAAALHREDQRKMEQKLQTLRKEWEQQCATEPPRVVDVAEITQVVATISGIPVEKAASSESERLLGLKDQLNSAIIGQPEAVGRIVRAIQRNRVGLNDPNRPIGTFLFVGPTGVGKTLLARTLAREVFLNEQNFIRLDMSEYSESYAVSRLIGSPPGYVGYDEGGQLTEKVRRHPYSVVLFDEIEKAHPKIFNVLLQIMDEGHITDASGRKVNFKNTIIILTSNVGSRKLQDFGAGIGFNNHTAEHMKHQAESVIRKEIQRMFQPEFLNRIDDVILFSYLEQADIRRIVDIEVEKALKRVRNLGYEVHVDDETRDFLATHGYDRDLGARPLRRAIQKYIEDELCDTLLTINRDGKSPDHYTIQVVKPADKQEPEVSFVEQTT